MKKSIAIFFTFLIFNTGLIPTYAESSAVKYSDTYKSPVLQVGLNSFKIKADYICIIDTILKNKYDEIVNLGMNDKLRIELREFKPENIYYKDICNYISESLNSITGFLYDVEINSVVNNDLTITISHREEEIQQEKKQSIDKNINMLIKIIDKLVKKAKDEKRYQTMSAYGLNNSTMETDEWYKVWAIGEVLSEFCEYNYSAVSMGKPSDAPKLKKEISITDVDDKLSWSAYSIMNQRTAVCAGISSFTMMVCNKMNIPCIKVLGKSDNNNTTYHSWNEVYINNKWYAVDFTNVIGSGSIEGSTAVSTINNFKEDGYIWSELDVERIKALKYPELYLK